MKKTTSPNALRKVILRRESIRRLASPELDQIAGGIVTAENGCIPTAIVTRCHPLTPGCPM
jgi:hypothetical protein